MLVTALLACLALGAAEAQKPKVKPKPKSKPVAAKQLPGGVGALNVPVRLGEGDEVFQVVLTDASFETRVVNADDTIVAAADKKLLVLKFTVQNPHSTMDRFYRGDSFHWMVVGANADNYTDVGTAYNPDKLTAVSLELKPAQRIPLWTYIEIPKDDPVPKLMLTIQSSKNVVRYDLKGKVKPLTGIFAMSEPTAKFGENLPIGVYDWVVSAPESSTKSPIPSMEVEESAPFLTFPITVSNPGKIVKYFRYDSLQYEFTDADGTPVDIAAVDAVRASSPEPFAGDLKSGQALKLRLVFRLAGNAKPVSLTLKDPEKGRTIKLVL